MKKLILLLSAIFCIFAGGECFAQISSKTVYIGRGLERDVKLRVKGAPTWSRTNLSIECKLNNYTMADSTHVSAWLNSGARTTFPGFVQPTGSAQPIIGSGTGLWFKAWGQGMNCATNSFYPQLDTTIYIAVKNIPGASNGNQQVLFGGDGSWHAVRENTAISELQFCNNNTGQTNFPHINLNNQTYVACFRKTAFSGLTATYTVAINGLTIKSPEITMVQNANTLNLCAINAYYIFTGNWYCFLMYDEIHSDEEVLDTINKINKYLGENNVEKATLY